MRLLSIFQITDKRILDDCSQMGGGGGGLSEEKLLKQLVLERERESCRLEESLEESDHHLLMKASSLGRHTDSSVTHWTAGVCEVWLRVFLW